MKVLSIDASTKSSGWAIFEDKQLSQYNCITASSADLVERIKKMINELEKLLSNNSIDTIVLEEVRPETTTQNIKTHKALMYLQAAIVFLIHERYPSIKIEYLYPSEWRKVCNIKTGKGISRAIVKQSDIDFIKDKYHIEVNDDVADAIGIGFAYINRLKNEINWG